MIKERIDITEQEAIDLKGNITEEEKYFPNGSSGNKGEEVKTKCCKKTGNIKRLWRWNYLSDSED